jgi:hypothetical protein
VDRSPFRHDHAASRVRANPCVERVSQ